MPLHSIFTGQIADIAWQDVADFCDSQPAESAMLDYKEAMPRELEKTVAAMANTLGGVLLIGIEEDDESKPKLPIQGVVMQPGLVEQVTSICVDNIYPPVIPEVQLCTSDDRTRAVIVIRVPQSRDAPHAISKNTRVYVRTGRQNKPEELASVNEFLRYSKGERRQKTPRVALLSGRLNDSIAPEMVACTELIRQRKSAKTSACSLWR
jgi:predicted HTH transcriptional regulator